MLLTLSLLGALALDGLLGEPRRAHPLVGFGRCAAALEGWVRRRVARPGRLAGALCWMALVAGPVLLLCCGLAWLPGGAAALLSVVVLYLCIGARSLAAHARAVAAPLAAGDLAGARAAVAMIVSRDTAALDDRAVTAATLESVLENGSDALLAPLLWFLIAGAPGALCYRLVNTLDAMWGYRNARYRDFGYVAALADDLANRPAAVLAALAYSLCGATRQALGCWALQAPACASPNGGAVMAAGAGALRVSVGGSVAYGGQWRQRPVLGRGPAATAGDIGRALSLLWRSTALLVVGVALLEWRAWT